MSLYHWFYKQKKEELLSNYFFILDNKVYVLKKDIDDSFEENEIHSSNSVLGFHHTSTESVDGVMYYVYRESDCLIRFLKERFFVPRKFESKVKINVDFLDEYFKS